MPSLRYHHIGIPTDKPLPAQDQMKTDGSPGSRPQLLLAVWLVLGSVACSGCAYFRCGERSYEEVQRAQQEQREIDRLPFKPGTVFYSR